MLLPRAIIFPLFTLLEDFGYRLRVELHLDRLIKRTLGGHGNPTHDSSRLTP